MEHTSKDDFLAVFDKILNELLSDLCDPEMGMPESVVEMTREVCIPHPFPRRLQMQSPLKKDSPLFSLHSCWNCPLAVRC
jgi:hypothetical protein